MFIKSPDPDLILCFFSYPDLFIEFFETKNAKYSYSFVEHFDP